jgi:monoamine oxidase
MPADTPDSPLKSRLSRRTLVAGAATLVAAPALAQGRNEGGDFDCVIVGAGAAGISAARRLMAPGRRIVVVEAMDRVGGRCTTETTTFGVPYDRGAHWIHMPDINPVGKLGASLGFDVYPAPDRAHLRVNGREAREGEIESFYAGITRSTAAISKAARRPADAACSTVMPKDLRDWRATADFVMGPFGCAKDLTDVSIHDFASSAEREIDAFCREGFGALLAKLAEGVPLRLATPVTRIGWGRRGVEVTTARGTFTARQAIITCSTNLIASGRIVFDPVLPAPMREGFGKLTLGTYNHATLELPGNPLGLKPDTLVYAKATDAREAGMLAHVSGTPLVMVDTGGRFGKQLEDAGEAEMIAFATDWLVAQFGTSLRGAIRRTHATRWGREPWILGAYSAAPPGGQPLRTSLMEPLADRVWFAGEALHEALWGTVAGAWESGERAADQVVRRLPRPRT